MGYAINLSLAKSFSVKHEYEISPLQEALAIGVGNTVGSVFGTITSTSSLSRTSCQGSGLDFFIVFNYGRTQSG